MMGFDIIVVGGGTAGTIAAIQAARAGSRTLLVERNSMLGGTTTVGGIHYPGIFHAWGKQVIAGIGWELVERAVHEAGDTLPDLVEQGRPHWTYHVRVDPFIYAGLCLEAVVDAGCELLLHAMVATVERVDDGWGLQLCTKTGLRPVRTRQLIDCTGDANVVTMAGAQTRVIEAPQPATLTCLASGYDVDTLDLGAINAAMEAEVQAGHLAYTDGSWNTKAADAGSWLRGHGNNRNHFDAPDAHTSEGRTALEITAQLAMLRFCRFLRAQEGLANLNLSRLAGETGVRETVTIVGKETITAEDYVTGRLWDDAVCHAFYPIDLHELKGAGLDCRQLEPGVVPSIPRGALLPRDTEGLLVAGRCLSSDRLANSALRVQAPSMATGQATGALAHLAASSGVDPRHVPHNDLRALLEAHNAIVPTGSGGGMRRQ